MSKFLNNTWRIKFTVLTIILLAFYDGLCNTYLFQYVENLILEFGVAEETPSENPYVFWIGVSFEIGRIFTSLIWGDIIDRKGEKYAITKSLILFTFTNLIFGISTNFFLAFVLRMISGAFMGVLIGIKTIIANFKPESFRNWVLPLVFTSWSAGTILGPYIGSIFFNVLEDSSRFYGCLFVSAIGVILIFMSEHIEEFNEGLIRAEFGANIKTTFLDEDGSIAYSDDLTLREKYGKIMKMTNSNKLTTLTGLLFFYGLSLGILLPIWMTSTLDVNGLQVENITVDPFILILTLPAFLLQIAFYPFLLQEFSNFSILAASNWVQFAVFFCLPFTVRFVPLGETGVGMYLGFCIFVRNFATLMMLCSIQEFTNSSVIKIFRGKINAIQVLIISLVNVIGPLIYGDIVDFGFNIESSSHMRYAVPFLFLVILSGLGTKITYDLQFEDIEKNKIISDSARYVQIQMS